MKIGFIGVGHMAGSILKAISKNTEYEFYINDINYNHADDISKVVSNKIIKCSSIDVIDNSDLIFLGVKPKDLTDILSGIKNHIKDKLIISMAAGFSIDKIINITGDINLIRIMPNTPVAVSSGVTFYTKYKVSEDMLHKFIEVMSYTGSLYEIAEDKMDVVSVLTGSTPAYLDYFIDALSEFGVSKGFTKEESIEYVLKMALGTILLNLSSSKSPKELGDEVCSPGGSTIEGIKVLLDNDFYKIINDAANASYNKNKKML